MNKFEFLGYTEEDIRSVENDWASAESLTCGPNRMMNGPDHWKVTDNSFERIEPAGKLDHSKTNLPTCRDFRKMEPAEVQRRFLAGELGCAEPQRGME